MSKLDILVFTLSELEETSVAVGLSVGSTDGLVNFRTVAVT